MQTNIILHGDNRDVLKTLPDASVDLICTDVPYGLGTREPTLADLIKFLQGGGIDTRGDFMGKKWSLPTIDQWRECLRVLKPGGNLFTFGGTRTFDLIALGLRAAGFEYRDTLMWLYGEGMPHGLNVSKAIDKDDGLVHAREVVGSYIVGGRAAQSIAEKGGTYTAGAPPSKGLTKELFRTLGATDKSREWDDWDTALKPAWEPILWFQKPPEGTVVKNVLKYCTGAINIGACRISTSWDEPDRPESWRQSGHSAKPDAPKIAAPPGNGIRCHPGGRWPANVLFSHAEGCRRIGQLVLSGDRRGQCNGTRPGGFGNVGADSGSPEPNARVYGDEKLADWNCADGCPVKLLNAQAGLRTSGSGAVKRTSAKGYQPNAYGRENRPVGTPMITYGDTGYASRYFTQLDYEPFFYCPKATASEVTVNGAIVNTWPTRKPVGVIRWLIKLGARPGAIVLDPWCGSGATPIACLEEGMKFIAIDKDDEAIAICRARVAARLDQGVQTNLFWALEQK